MSTLVFPMNLPGLDMKVERTEEFATKIKSGGWWSLKEERTKGLSVPRFRWAISFAGLRPAKDAPAPNAAYKEHAIILKFLRDHYGAFDTFLFDCPLDGFRRTVRLVQDSLVLARENVAWWSVKKLELATVGTATTATIAPTTATIARNTTQQFTGLVTDAAFDNSIDWTVEEGGGGTVVGGLYTAPNSAGTYHVRATSHEAGVTVYGRATVTVT